MPEEPLGLQLLRLANGYQVSQAVHVVAALGVADVIAGGAPTADEIAEKVGAHPRSLYRVLRALAAAGVLDEGEGRRFALTPMGELLRADHPESLAGWAVNVGQPYFWQAWGHLLHGVRTGENAFQSLNGMDVWEYRASRPEENSIFNRAMTALSRNANALIVKSFDFSRFQTIVDIGGGHGALLAAILNANRGARGIVFDQPHVVEGAPVLLREAGVADRCDAVGGDMFDAVPAGADAYVMKSILHDWEDDECEAILRVIRAAIVDDGRLLVVDQLVAPPNEGAQTKFSDLNMFVMPGGQERTREEFGALFARAGFRLVDVHVTGGRGDVIEAAPVPSSAPR